MDKKISVIIPIYNTEKFLARCVDSVINQTYTNLQIILVDDGATDSSPAICDNYAKKDPRVTVIHKKNGGLSSARNAGIDAAEGDYIGFVDSDDFISPTMYESLLNNIGSTDNELANAMYVRYFDDGSQTPSIVPHTTNEQVSSVDFIRELMLHVGDVSVCTKLFPKKLLDNLRFCEGKCNEDLLFMIDLLTRIEKVNFVGEVGYYYYTRSGSLSSGYGKAVEDMVGNSVAVVNSVLSTHPQLKAEAERFALYQHMAYFLLLPQELANKKNEIYVNALKYIRNKTVANIGNKYLNTKCKAILLAFCVAPKFFIKLFKLLKK